MQLSQFVKSKNYVTKQIEHDVRCDFQQVPVYVGSQP
ncbi:hypothetical protein [Acinetobacter phage Ab69]|nr:hypothetical protein [Acinetobacter phage Ab69]